MKLRLAIALLMSLVITPAQSAEIPLLYSKSELIIARKSLTPDPSLLPWQKDAAEAQNKLTFTIEVRDGRSLYNQQGWFNLSSYEEQSGVLLAFSSPTQSPIVASKQYAAVDILFIDLQGRITQIVPNIMLAELQEEIVPAAPVLAFLFLKSGTCEKMFIKPGDEVEYSLFKKPPTVLTAPSVVQSAPVIKTVPVPAPVAPIETLYPAN